MSEQLLVAHCSPTLAGIKTGSLFACEYPCRKKLFCVVRRWNRMLNPKGVYVRAFCSQPGRALMYVYRKKKLEQELHMPEARAFLETYGYDRESGLPEIFALLSRRLRESREFPHEIGLFLGYPLADVKGFIENRGRNCKCAGCWKVYGDEQTAQKLFMKYRKCTDVYCRKLKEGTPILRLTVAA